MKLTNKHNLPQPLVEAVSAKRYDDGGSFITATGLLKPPLIGVLEGLHKDKLEEDASDRIWSLLGSVAHDILEKNATTGIAEKRLFAQIGDYKFSGQLDHLALEGGSALTDYKLTSAWSVVFGKDEWEEQLNILDWLLYVNGYPLVEKLQICAILRDWNKREAQNNHDYPQHQVVIVPIEHWTRDSQEAFVARRLAMHVAARDHLVVPECSDEERWYAGTKYAVKKEGRKTAVRVLGTKEEAESYIEDKNLDSKHFIETRIGANRRCDDYCSVSEWCPVLARFRGEDT